LITGSVIYGKDVVRIVGVYVNRDLERKLEELKEWMDEREKGVKTIIGGDFNARTGEEGGKVEGEEWEEGMYRRSMDKTINKEGKRLVECIRERGWWVLNGEIRGDEEGTWTFSGGRGESVIDYVLVNEDIEEEVVQLVVGDNIESDHHPLVVQLREKGSERKKENKRNKARRGVWDEEGRASFRQELGEIGLIGKGIQEEVEALEDRIKKALEKGERERWGDRRVNKGWWDEECKKKKKIVRKSLRDWRRGKENRQEYQRERREYREICEEKKKEENLRWEREVEGVRREGQVWGIVNKERKKWKGINEGIKMEEWEIYFKGLLGGIERRVVQGTDKKGRRGMEKELEKEEINEVLRRVKDGKAMGVDDIPGEVWKYGGEEMEEWVWQTCNRVWRGEGWPGEWKEGVLLPILKKGQGMRVEEYRGVTVMPSLYKIYTTVLVDRLREEVETKEMLPQSQTGFRKGIGTIDNIFTLNYLINRQIGRKGGKMVAVFVDLRAAFDSVDRGTMISALRERGVREGLVERVAECLRETKSRVRVRGETGKGF